MKTTLTKFIPVVLLAIGAAMLAACASSKPSPNTVSQLATAGFRLKSPETPHQKEIFAKLPAYKVESIIVKGQTFYVYKDESKGLALVGHEAEYQRYRQIARRDRLQESHYNAEMASAAEARTWQGASGSDWWR